MSAFQMSKGLLVAAGLLAATTAASAADLRMPVKAPPPVAVFSWTGFYLGGNIGYSWGRATDDQSDLTTVTTTTRLFRGQPPGQLFEIVGPSAPPFPAGTFPMTAAAFAATGTSGTANVNGVIGGGQLGYNWQIDRSWVLGLEADIQGSDERGSTTACDTPGCPAGSTIGTADVRLRWFGTVRGRVGILPWDRVMLYATGGLAYGQLDTSYFSGINGGSITIGGTNTTRAGFAVGGGVEGAIDQHWSVKGEYLFLDLGTFNTNLGAGAAVTLPPVTTLIGTFATTIATSTVSTAATARTRFFDHILRVGFNYRF